MTFTGRFVGAGHVRLRVQVVVGEGLNGTLHDQIGFALNSALRDRIEVGEAVALSARWQLDRRILMRKG